jgi:hypothetical protein
VKGPRRTVASRLCLAVVWAVWTIRSTPQPMKKAWDLFPAFFGVPSSKLFRLLRRWLGCRKKGPRAGARDPVRHRVPLKSSDVQRAITDRVSASLASRSSFKRAVFSRVARA